MAIDSVYGRVEIPAPAGWELRLAELLAANHKAICERDESRREHLRTQQFIAQLRLVIEELDELIKELRRELEAQRGVLEAFKEGMEIRAGIFCA